MNAQASTMFETFQQPRRMICGVCANLAVRSGLPAWSVRVAAVLLLLTHGLLALLLYFGAAAWLRAPQAGTWRDMRRGAGAQTPPSWDRDGLVSRFDRLDQRLSRMEREAVDHEASLRAAFRDLDK